MMMFVWMLETPQQRKNFEAIYQAHKDIMYAHAYSILKDVPSAEDAVSDSFVSLARNFSKTDTMDCNQLRSYLIIIARNAAFKIYNKRKREISTEDVYFDTENPDNFTLHTERQELYQTLFGLIRQLDPKYGDVVMLRYYCEMREKDIADSLGISVENVKVRLHRAKALLKKMLKEGGYCD